MAIISKSASKHLWWGTLSINFHRTHDVGVNPPTHCVGSRLGPETILDNRFPSSRPILPFRSGPIARFAYDTPQAPIRKGRGERGAGNQCLDYGDQTGIYLVACRRSTAVLCFHPLAFCTRAILRRDIHHNNTLKVLEGRVKRIGRNHGFATQNRGYVSGMACKYGLLSSCYLIIYSIPLFCCLLANRPRRQVNIPRPPINSV